MWSNTIFRKIVRQTQRTLNVPKFKPQMDCQVEQFYLLTCHTHFSHQLNMANTVEDSNEKHLAPWSAACERDGTYTTPLSPYLDQVSQLSLHG